MTENTNITCQSCGNDCEIYEQVNTAQIGIRLEWWCYCGKCDIETFHPIKIDDKQESQQPKNMKQIEKPEVGKRYFVEVEILPNQNITPEGQITIRIDDMDLWLDDTLKLYEESTIVMNADGEIFRPKGAIDSPPLTGAAGGYAGLPDQRAGGGYIGQGVCASAGSGYSGGPIVAASGSGGTATLGLSHNPVTGRPYKFDPANWCVDIADERNRGLLPKFKEWFKKRIYRPNAYNFSSRYYGLSNNNNSISKTNFNWPLYTLSELKTHMPEVFGVDEPEWRPKEGQRVFINRLNQEATIREIKTIYYLECHDGYFELGELSPLDTIASKIKSIAPDLNDQQVEGLVKLVEGC